MAITGMTTCLTFEDQAGEAAEFYAATFPGARILATSHYGPNMPMPEGTVLTVEFELFGQPFLALNGPAFAHSPAISFQVFCDTQEEVDRLWEALTGNGGEESMCGWCSDRFGVSWQVIPRRLPELLSDERTAGPATQAMMTMRKLDIAGLEAAALSA